MSHRARTASTLAAVTALAVTLTAGPVTAQTVTVRPYAHPGRLAVAWNDATSGTGRVAALSTAAPFEWLTPALETGRDPLVRHAHGRVLVVSPVADSVLVVSPEGWFPLDEFHLGAGSAPLDVALAGRHRAYVTRAAATHLLRLDLRTGATAEVCDLAPFADADGIPDLGLMAVHDGRLFVQVRARNRGVPAVQPPAYLAVVDLATETLIDVDPARPGVQAIELRGTWPRQKMQVVPETGSLFVASAGGWFDAGGIEEIGLGGLVSRRLVVREADGVVGADLGAFALVGAGRGFLTYSTDFATSSHLSVFTLDGSVESVPDFYLALGYSSPALAYAPETNVVFFPEAGYAPPGLQVFDASTGARLTSVPIATTGPPTDLELLTEPIAPARLAPRR